MADDDASPRLEELRRELEAMGMVVVPFRDEIHIRRSTLEYIKVRLDRGVLHCEPYVGMMSQARTTWVLLAIEAIAIPTVVSHAAATSIALTAAFTGLLAFGVHALRYTLSEIAVSRIQTRWLDLRERHRLAASSSPGSLASSATRQLPADQPILSAESAAKRARTPVT